MLVGEELLKLKTYPTAGVLEEQGRQHNCGEVRCVMFKAGSRHHSGYEDEVPVGNLESLPPPQSNLSDNAVAVLLRLWLCMVDMDSKHHYLSTLAKTRPIKLLFRKPC